MESNLGCAYCIEKKDSMLTCKICGIKVHIQCLKMTRIVGRLLGDAFYTFVCDACSSKKIEEVLKDNVTWLQAVVLALYNLHHRSFGISRFGFFHWKIHICDFIERNWFNIFGNSNKAKKMWHGTVAGTLSMHSSTLFESSVKILNENGWWRLYFLDMHPQDMIEKNEKVAECLKYLQRRAKLKNREIIQSDVVRLCQAIQYINNPTSGELVGESSNSVKTEPSDADVKSEPQLFSSDMDVGFAVELDSEEYEVEDELSSEEMDVSDNGDTESIDSADVLYKVKKENGCEDFSNFSINMRPRNNNEGIEENIQEKSIKDDDTISETDFDSSVLPCLFKTSPPQSIPCDVKNYIKHPDKCVPMTVNEEFQMKETLRHMLLLHRGKVPPEIARYYRKLCLRQEKRERGLPIFDIDRLAAGKKLELYEEEQAPLCKQTVHKYCILDRFQNIPHPLKHCYDKEQPGSFLCRLMGMDSPSTCFCSPYTKRYLKPFIRQDFDSMPLWLSLMEELVVKVNKNIVCEKKTRYPIDYCYIKPEHIPAINSLCQTHFYPKIDLTECLEYPDFTCVVLYKKLIVGFAVMVPDVSHFETYISFIFTRPEWRKAGIGSFMLYHLIQTCMGKDITLHVSAANPAILLYQKFGFKVEEFIKDFYDKYFPASSKECRHALFMRLQR